MNKLLLVLLIIPLALFYGCSATTYTADYKTSLSRVERPVKAVQLYGASQISSLPDSSKYNFSFEDSLVKISWSANSKEINLLIKNKTNNTVKIPWDEAAFVDKDGFSHRVIHSSIDYLDKEKPQPPSVIVRNGLLEDSIIPTDYLKWIEIGGEHPLSYWNLESFFPDNINSKDSKLDDHSVLVIFVSAVKLNIGKEFQILLPLQCNDNTYEYIFIFKIDSVNVVTKK